MAAYGPLVLTCHAQRLRLGDIVERWIEVLTGADNQDWCPLSAEHRKSSGGVQRRRRFFQRARRRVVRRLAVDEVLHDGPRQPRRLDAKRRVHSMRERGDVELGAFGLRRIVRAVIAITHGPPSAAR
jgi:hypothetical protein